MKRIVAVVCVILAGAGAVWVGCGSDESGDADAGSGASGASGASGSSGTGNTSIGGTGDGGNGEGGNSSCNPVTNEPCALGEACDAADNAFVCFAEGNVGGLCEPCDSDAGEFCQGGLACVGTTCMRYCCTDADCGTGTCVKTDRQAAPFFDFAPDVGLCLVEESGTGGGGGAGGGGPVSGPGCDAPAEAPSMGSCYEG